MHLPTLNACLNATSALLLVAAWFAVRSDRKRLHQRLMLTAVGTSALFLGSYVVHHAQAGTTYCLATGPAYVAYSLLLWPHVVLAAVLLPLIAATMWRGFRSPERHPRLAKVTLSTWLYVSVTGVALYLVVHRLFPSSFS
ncbi:MAG TPA: DUF420 domain-containing protein [Myxococcota bacterium]|nr:DUF420 domain-containing protein [Myxococcota bacterium]